MAKAKILVLTSTFPRWLSDTTPSFVFDLANRIAEKYNVVVLAPHYSNAKKKEFYQTIYGYKNIMCKKLADIKWVIDNPF